MTDWAHKVIDAPSAIDAMKQEGSAEETGVVSRLAHYEKLRWFGNAAVQGALFVIFLISFLCNTAVGLGGCIRRLFGGQPTAIVHDFSGIVNFKRAICAFNVLILFAFVAVMLSVMDQWHPSCPSPLLYVPLVGTVSAIATVALLVMLARTRRAPDCTVARRLWAAFDLLCLILFVPYLLYWNLIGYHF